MSSNIRKRVPKGKTIILFFWSIFILWQILLDIKYEGWYSFDELYHISSSNLAFDAVSEYNRAPQINFAIKILTTLLGKSYYVFKLLPLFLSCIAVFIILYLTWKMTENKFLIVVAAALMGLNRLLVCYHMMIRFYVWNEVMVALLALLLYEVSVARKTWTKYLLHICYFFVMSITYFIHKNEESYLSILMVGAMAWGANCIVPYFLKYIRRKEAVGKFVILFLTTIGAMECCVLAMKVGILDIPSKLERFMLGVKAPDLFYIPHYFTKQGLIFTIALLVYGKTVLKEEIKREIIGIYILAFVPFLAYNIFFSDKYIIRGMGFYFPMMILVVVLWFNTWERTKGRFILMIGMVAIGIWLSYSDIGVQAFYDCPDIPGEYNIDNYEGLISKAQKEIANGRKCIAVWENDHQQACFDLNTEYSFTINDSINNPHNISEDEVIDLYVFLMETDEPYMLLVGPHTDFRIDKIMPGFMHGMKAKYPYDEFTHYEFLIYIN